MLLGIDHIVIVVRDLEQAAKDYERLGFTVILGGRHPVGTYNALISLADGSYIELIAFYEANPNHRWWAALQRGGGLVDFCMQTDDLRGDTAKFRAAGVEIADPQPLTRARPDGYQLKWLLSIPRGGHRGVAPFLIEDETPRDERIPREKSHKNGASGIATVTVAVNDLESVERWYGAVLGSGGKKIDAQALKAQGVRFEVGSHILAFVNPVEKDSPLAHWLEERGPSPYAAVLKTTQKNPPALDPGFTHGALLSFE